MPSFRGFSYRQGYRAGWRSEPIPPGSCSSYREGWHAARLALRQRELELLGVCA